MKPKVSPKKPAKSTKPVIPKTTVSKTAALSKTADSVAASKANTYFYAVGKRKTATASVRLYAKGKGQLTINNRAFGDYFPVAVDQDKVLSPLKLCGNQKTFDITVKAYGGGVHSQAEAVRHGISKALLEYDPGLRSTLKHVGFLTRDSRVKERKKYGLKRARRAPQWQKR